MKILAKLWFLLLLAFPAWPQAQPPSTYQPQMISFNGVPFGVCDIYQFALNNTNGNYYSCQISTRTWILIGGGNTTIQTYTVATLPVSPPTNTIAAVTDGNGSNCSTGGGALRQLCQFTGSSWLIIGGGVVTGISGSGTANTVSKFTAPNAIGNSSVTDDSVNPTRAPFGINSASGGEFYEWTVDPGGVVANELACRSPTVAANVVICPAGTTTTVLGVAKTTVAGGGTVQLCWAAKCPVISTNATTQNHFLIPSATVPGQVDDTGLATPPVAKTFSYLAETAVSGGQSVQITMSALDTLIALAGGGLPSCPQYSLISETGTGTAASYGCINPPSINGANYGLLNTPGASATNWQSSQLGIKPRALASSDSIAVGDVPNAVECSLTLCTVTVPDIGSTGFANNPAFRAINANGTLTFNNTSTSKLIVYDGAAATTYTSYSFGPGDFGTFQKDADGTDWAITITKGSQPTLGLPTATWANVSGSYSVPDSDQGYRLLDATAGATITLGAPNSVGVSPIVAVRVNSGNISSSPFSTTAFAQSANNQLAFLIANDSGTPRAVSSITDTAGDTFIKKCESISAGVTSVSIWVATGIASSGSNTVSITWAAAPGRAQVYGLELTGSTVDSSNCSTGSLISTGIHFSNALALGIGFDGTPTGWLQQGNVNGSEADSQLQHNVASVTYGVSGTNPTAAIGVITFSISSTPTFVIGWNFTAVNTSNGFQTIAGTINGQTNQILFPNESCSYMVGGTGASPSYNSLCSFMPNVQANGIVNGANTIYASDQTAGTSSIGATTIFTSASTPVSRYRISGRGTVTVVGTSCVSNTTVVLNVIYIDPISAGGTTTLTLPVTFTIVNNGTVGVSSGSFGSLDFEAKGSTAIQFSTTYTAGGSCSPAPTVQVTPILQVL